MLLEQLDVATQPLVAGDPGVVGVVPQADRLTDVDRKGDAEDVSSVGDEGGDGTGVLTFGQVARDADA